MEAQTLFETSTEYNFQTGLDTLYTGLDALKNLVTFKPSLALPLFFPNSRPV
jgi:hypothetical protein